MAKKAKSARKPARAGSAAGGTAAIVGPTKPRKRKSGALRAKAVASREKGAKAKAPVTAETESQVPNAPAADLVTKIAAKLGRRKVRLGRLERLEFAIDEVRLGARASPRTRKLQLSGVPKMAQKLIEEAAEVAIEAVQGNRSALVHESVDLLYNLLVLLSGSGVPLERVWAEMDRRELALGMVEKLPKAGEAEG